MKSFKDFIQEASTKSMLKGYVRIEENGFRSTSITAELTLHGESTRLTMEAMPNTMKSALVFKADPGTELSKADYDKKTLIERELASAESKAFRQAQGVLNNLFYAFNAPKVKKDEKGVIFYTF